MKESRLKRALGPVKGYFSGRDVNDNTVLAAHLRARGVPASGQPWSAAKEAMRQGATFEDAAKQAAASQAGHQPLRQVPDNEDPTPFQGRSLRWFPKQFGPGDIDGVGAKRLLGTPNIAPAHLLVRETGQNSWDARGTSESIDFTLNLRRLPPEVIDTLRRRVFTDDPPSTGLAELLNRDEVLALEVSDRGTIGLGGPIRNDLALDAGEDTNFIDLVFNIGAPRDVHLGGGTYGFGKTITYVVSSVGTVLIWSRCEGGLGQEHRLIGSAIGDGFNQGGLRYTGRHWWGNAIPDEDRVEPVVGDLADELGSQVFSAGFDADVTGTSLLILDPQLGADSPEEAVEMLADAVVWNLWPKMLTEQTGRARMRIDVQLDGRSIELPTVEEHSVLGGHAACLLAVRAAQSGRHDDALRTPYPLDVREIWCNRPRKLLGHLALTRYPAPRGIRPSHWVSLMRHQAELVVKHLPGTELDVEGFQWAGVFKPVAEVDDSFAQAEPPAHDDWVPQAVQDKPRRRDVNVALTRIKESADEFLSPRPPEAADTDPVSSVAHLGDLLADLLTGLQGPAPSSREPRTSQRASGRRPRRPQAEVVAVAHESAEPGWTRTTIDVQLSSTATGPAEVDALVRVGVDGGSLDDAQAVRVLGWMGEDIAGDARERAALIPGESRQFVYEARSDLAIDIETRLADDS